MSSIPRVKAVLFDLDGTLADTAPDMADALNILLSKHGRPALDYELVRKNTSRGSIALIQLGFKEVQEEQHINKLRNEFLEIYADNLHNRTELFPGVNQLLTTLDNSNIPWGIVTNKPSNLAEPLIQNLVAQKLDSAFSTACIVSGDSLARRKPDPDQLHHAAKMLGINEQDTIYMGDDPRDVIAGKAAGMSTAVAAYGYIQDDEDPLSWDADVIFQQALDLKDWLFSNS